MKTIMFTRDNATRFWTHGKVTTIRAVGKSGKPRFRAGEMASLRVWSGRAYGSKTVAFAEARILAVTSLQIEGDRLWLFDGPRTDDVTKRFADDHVKHAVAKQDGFDSWDELKTALQLYHGDTLTGWQYRLELNMDSLNREAIREPQA